jgi:hypothetical protein
VASLSAAPVKSEIADAAMRGDTAAVRALIAKKVDVSAPQNDGSTGAALGGAARQRRAGEPAGARRRQREGGDARRRDAAVAGQPERRSRRRSARCSKPAPIRTRSCRSAARR